MEESYLFQLQYTLIGFRIFYIRIKELNCYPLIVCKYNKAKNYEHNQNTRLLYCGKSNFPNSVVEVSTAVPAFIGHTERAISGNQSLLNKPWRITSMAEFQTYFGGPSQDLGKYLLYYSMMLFYANGGGSCYIVSVGDYKTEITSERLISGIEELVCEHEPTLLVIPETTLLPDVVSSAKVHMAMLSHCGCKMKNRIAILDIYEGYKERNDPSGDKVLEFRESIGDKYLDFGVAYYPWINTTIIMPQDLNGLEELNLMPPGSAMAGIYTMIDNTRGVWKAPANVKINRVLSPSVNITNQDQEDLNVPLNGKSINAIRFFTGEGTIVWGRGHLTGIRMTGVTSMSAVPLLCSKSRLKRHAEPMFLNLMSLIHGLRSR